MPSIEDMEKMLEEQQKLLEEMRKQLGKKPIKKRGKTKKESPKKLPEISSKEIPSLIKKMNKDELKKIFGLDIGRNEQNPYKCSVKEFVKRYNITSNTKWGVYLTYAHKHEIIKKLYGNKPKKMCLEYLEQRLPEAKNGYVEKALKEEIERWG